MRAVVWKAPRRVAVENVPDPKIEAATDAIIRLTTTAICGSDLHMYEGRTQVEPGKIFGHENMGIVEEIGSDVQLLKKGDRVVLPFNIACGVCFNCTRGYTNACLITNPDSHGGGYGYSGMGPYAGGQADFLRVPFADFNALRLPGEPNDEHEDDFLLLSDIFPTGYHATELAHVKPGDSVAIFGAGPVGLLSALSARIKGAAEIYVVDALADRLERAQRIEGVTPIDLRKGDPVEQIVEARRPFRESVQDLLGRQGEKMPGVMCSIDAVGYESYQNEDPGGEQNPNQSIENCIRVTNPTGHIGLIGVYFPKDPLGVNEDEKQGKFTMSLGLAWNKGLTIGMGQCPVKQYNVYLRDLIVRGLAKPDLIVSHHIPIEEAPSAYEAFDTRADGYTKVLIKPGMTQKGQSIRGEVAASSREDQKVS